MPLRPSRGHQPSDRSGEPLVRPLPQGLSRDIEAAGYHPQIVRDIVSAAVAGDEVVSHLVHQETTFDAEEIRRHVTVLVLTATRLVIAHLDDHEADHVENAPTAMATTETVPLSRVTGVMLTHVISDPERYRAGALGREVTITLGWGAVSRIDVGPATCGDPSCDADHGFDGTLTSDDVAIRVSATAEGDASLRQALAFAAAVQSALGR